MASTIKIFYSYSHKDEKLLKELQKQLSLMKRQGLITELHDRRIVAGQEWANEIDRYLNTAHIILLLVSPDFMASDFCYSIELQQAIKRHEQSQASVIPIIVRKVDWHSAPFGKLQALPKDGKPVTSYSDRDKAFADITKGIRRVVETLITQEAAEKITAISEMRPPTNPETIQQREQAVKEIYERLAHPKTSAVVLTGIAGLGKSTLAALVYNYAEEQRKANVGPFSTKACWMTIEEATTFVNIGEFILKALDTTKEDFKNSQPENQALTLFKALNTTENPRLVILNQFEEMLDMSTGQTRKDRPGVGEWIDLLNDNPCTCRILLTSRPWPCGTRPFAAEAHMRKYHVKELSIPEGVELLRTQGVGEMQATEEALRQAVINCNGHAWSLTCLASILCSNSSITLNDLLTDSRYSSLWKEHIERNLLDFIYEQQLDDIQRSLLLAFSVYRGPTTLEAAEAIMTPQFEGFEIIEALNKLLKQHLLEGAGHLYYQLHAIVADYAHDHFDKKSKEANKRALQAAHVRAAQYYLQQVSQQQLSAEEIPNPEDRKVP